MIAVHRSAAPVRVQLNSASWPFATMSATAFFMLAICWSPLLPGLLSISSSYAFLAGFLVLAALIIGKRGLDVPILLLSAMLIMCSLLLLVATGSLTLLARTVPLGLLIFAAHQIVSIEKLTDAICRSLTVWLVFGILLSIFGFGYAYAGGEPLLSILNPDGRENFLYLTTFTNSSIGNIIRPSMIYDEPGAFSFLICATVALRDMQKKSRRPSYFLMIGGLITLSLAHLIITFLFLVTRLGLLRTCMLASIIAMGISIAIPETSEFDFLAARFALADGRLAGDNRSNQLDNFADIYNTRILLFGDVVCHDRPDRTCEEHGDISSSPATPIYYGGLLMFTVQIAVHILLLVAFFRQTNFRFAALTLSILLLQRPFFAGFGYGLITYIILFSMFKYRRFCRRDPIADIPPLSTASGRLVRTSNT